MTREAPLTRSKYNKKKKKKEGSLIQNAGLRDQRGVCEEKSNKS